jgi:hypothetical protein
MTSKPLQKSIIRIALATAFILMVPLVAMQFTAEVNWSLGDFVVMGVLLFGAGFTYVLIARLSNILAYRAAVGIAVAAGLFLIWINLAVGLIGSEDNPANQLYAGVLAIGFIGALIARFRPRGMARALFATALAQFLVPVMAMIIWEPRFTVEETPGVVGVFILNGFFAALFVVSALLFRRANASDPR